MRSHNHSAYQYLPNIRHSPYYHHPTIHYTNIPRSVTILISHSTIRHTNIYITQPFTILLHHSISYRGCTRSRYGRAIRHTNIYHSTIYHTTTTLNQLPRMYSKSIWKRRPSVVNIRLSRCLRSGLRVWSLELRV